MIQSLENDFFALEETLKKISSPGEHFQINLEAEESLFVRLNHAKVRQSGFVNQLKLHFSCSLEKKEGVSQVTGTIELKSLKNQTPVLDFFKTLQKKCKESSCNPYAVLPKSFESSRFVSESMESSLRPIEEELSSSLKQVVSYDVVGIVQSGPIVRGFLNSKGTKHWFGTTNFTFDYSIYTPSEKALKATLSLPTFQPDSFLKSIEFESKKLEALQKSPKKLSPGAYRTYLAPAALRDFASMLSWGAISESRIQEKKSFMRLLRSNERSLSSLLSLRENFKLGLAPKFNSEGQSSQDTVSLLENGKLVSSLVSSRSEKEFSVPSNAAEGSEGMRSFEITPGSLKESEATSKIHDGLYVSNLHYLNWSDEQFGRVTGLTRFACFVVEKGELVAPLETLRFDDDFFSVLGSELEELTDQTHLFPEVSTYESRNLGGGAVPGALLKKMKFTL